MDRSDIRKNLSIFILTAVLSTPVLSAFAEEAPKAASSAAPALSADALAAKNEMFSRRGRLMQIAAWLADGTLGENKDGLLAVRGKSKKSVEGAVKDENADREKLFKALSQKNGTTVTAQRKLYAEKRRKEAPKGSPVQAADGTWGIKA